MWYHLVWPAQSFWLSPTPTANSETKNFWYLWFFTKLVQLLPNKQNVANYNCWMHDQFVICDHRVTYSDLSYFSSTSMISKPFNSLTVTTGFHTQTSHISPLCQGSPNHSFTWYHLHNLRKAEKQLWLVIRTLTF